MSTWRPSITLLMSKLEAQVWTRMPIYIYVILYGSEFVLIYKKDGGGTAYLL